MSDGSAQFRMANRLADGRLQSIIGDKRAAGSSFDRIARELYADFGIEVTRQTLANWADELGIEEVEDVDDAPEAAAS